MKNTDKNNEYTNDSPLEHGDKFPPHRSQKQVGQNMSGNYDPEYTILDGPRNENYISEDHSESRQAQQSSDGTKQGGQQDYSPSRDQRSNVQAANDDVMTKGHVVTSQQDLEDHVDNEGTTTEGR